MENCSGMFGITKQNGKIFKKLTFFDCTGGRFLNRYICLLLQRQVRRPGDNSQVYYIGKRWENGQKLKKLDILNVQLVEFLTGILFTDR